MPVSCCDINDYLYGVPIFVNVYHNMLALYPSVSVTCDYYEDDGLLGTGTPLYY